MRRLLPRLTRPLSTTHPRPTSYRRFGDPSPSPVPYSAPRKPRFPNYRHPSPIVYVVLGGGGIYYLAHLEQVPETGRWRFMDVSPAMETQLGQEGFAQTMSEYRGRVLPEGHPTTRAVRGVVRRITEASGLEAEGGWETFVVAEEETRNACVLFSWRLRGRADGRRRFVLPGGKIFVFTGILPVCADKDGLAIVLGHGTSSPLPSFLNAD